MLQPGATIGILGGGQLGRMLAIEAARLGFRCHIYTPERHSVAAEVAADDTLAPWDDADALEAFATTCDVVTWEFENVPVPPLAVIEDKLAPHPRALKIAQDRLSEKQFVEELGGITAPHAAVDSLEDLTAAIERIGAPGILKTRRDGYDGKGQWRINAPSDVDDLKAAYRALIYEGMVQFEGEFSVIMARSASGEVCFWDSTHNIHEGGILAKSVFPPLASITEQIPAARELAAKVAEKLDYVGVLTLEFFATADGPIFNEMAPRVHNSGHWTIEGAATCQFANHIRAIAGLPLGSTETTVSEVEMLNLLGDDIAGSFERLSDPETTLHLYGKHDARTGRKMGHETRVKRPAQIGDDSAGDTAEDTEPNGEIFLVYARAANGVIGVKGDLPWHIPADLKRFKALTSGKPMIMGRKTFQSLPGLLPGRRHIVLSRHEKWDYTGAELAHEVQEAIDLARHDNPRGNIAIIGGAAIFDVFESHASRVELTQIHADYPGDVFMPELGPAWVETARKDHPAAGDLPAFSFITYTRKADEADL